MLLRLHQNNTVPSKRGVVQFGLHLFRLPQGEGTIEFLGKELHQITLIAFETEARADLIPTRNVLQVCWRKNELSQLSNTLKSI